MPHSTGPHGSERPALPASVVAEVRTGEVAMLGGTGIRSAIGKATRSGAVPVGPTGLGGDSQCEDFHGGEDRAVLLYDPGHYPVWQRELPDRAERFVPGAFGENLVVPGLDERTLCIGDVVRAGTAVLQVTQPRNPCYKLNHRFGRPDMARLTQDSGRTGCLFRVLTPGEVAPGDTVEVVERPLPDWPVSRVQHYLYTATGDLAAAAELARLPHLAAAMTEKFAHRVEAGQVEDWSGRLSNGDVGAGPRQWLEVEVRAVQRWTPTIVALDLHPTADDALPAWEPGAHVEVAIANGGWTNSYSLCGPLDAPGYRIAVKRVEDGRGGSRHLHEHVTAGTRLMVSAPANHFPLARDAERHVLVAGGIGVTPFLAMAEALARAAAEWELHLSVRDADEAAPVAALAAAHPGRVCVWDGSGRHPGTGGRADLPALLAGHRPGTHLYTCGSRRFVEGVLAAAAHWPAGTVHVEAFQAAGPPAAEAFTALPVGADPVPVPADRTLLSALRAAGHTIPSECETGSCGTCRIRYRGGEVQHADLVLSPAERQQWLCPCVSRARGDLVVEIGRTGG